MANLKKLVLKDNPEIEVEVSNEIEEAAFLNEGFVPAEEKKAKSK